MMKKINLFLMFFLCFSSAVKADPLPILPNRILTYGAVDIESTKEKICTTGYTKTIRNVSETTKKMIFKLYNIQKINNIFEVDHLISLELGGSNEIINLWPESYFTNWNARDKDKIENRLRKLVCSNKISLEQAQFEIATDWISAYKKYIGDKRN